VLNFTEKRMWIKKQTRQNHKRQLLPFILYRFALARIRHSSTHKFDAFMTIIPAITRSGGTLQLPFVVLTCLFLDSHSLFSEI